MYQLNRLILTLCWVTLSSTSILAADSCEADGQPRVSLTSGCVEGLVKTTVLGRSYYSFQGIPYAAPPLGELRFKAPRPPLPWSGVLQAYTEPPACLQPWRQNPVPMTFSEDCLFLNVFTPYLKHPSGKPMPVMVWIHGGKFYQSSGSTYKYGPDFFFMKDIILVVINYRLGIFGQLNLNISEAQGNAAMKDNIAALRWVQREIAKFGGDPARVTIAGGSSGGSVVALLYVSPLAKGLFHRAISQSGAAICHFAFIPSTAQYGLRVAASLKCPTDDPREAVACLRNVPGSVLAEQQMVTGGEEGVDLPFLPTVETPLGEEVFLPDSPQNLISQSGDVPYLIGLNDGEGLMYVNKLTEGELKDRRKMIVSNLPVHMVRNVSHDVVQDITNKVEDFYFGRNMSMKDTIYAFVNFLTDKQFGFCILKTVEALRTRAPVYVYYFTFSGKFQPVHSYQALNLTGVCHGDELGYMFYRNLTVNAHNNVSAYPKDMEVVKETVSLWTNFVTYGNPTPVHEELNTTWKPASASANSYLNIGKTLDMVDASLLQDRVALWETLYQVLFNQSKQGIEEGHLALYTVLCLVAVFISVLAVVYFIRFRRERSFYYDI